MKAAGFEIGSHTLSHCDLTKRKKKERDQAYMKRIKRELNMSKKIIDRKLAQDTIYLSFPYGNYDQRILGISERAGYEMGLTVKRGGNPFFADPLYLKRDQVFRRGMEKFASRLRTFQKFSLQ
jgi:peptidoglycan/xylan/chitin deacetylase (PgdA/CDA1 family)